jgi:hypothetical protein
MMPDLLQSLANERVRDRERLFAARNATFGEPPDRRPHRAEVRLGYWLISIGCRLAATDLAAAAR